jgi:hypothetical protein
MNLEEARKVVWKQNNNQSFGELLDKGFLLKTRLDWILENADDTEVKEAARVIQESLNKKNPIPSQNPLKPIPVSMTIENARKVLWPLYPYKGKPMGNLLDSRQIGLKDLGNIVEKTWDKNLKNAAITLMLARLDQVIQEPEPQAGLVKITSGGRSFSQVRQLQITLVQGGILGAVFALGLFYLLRYLINLPNSQPNGNNILSLLNKPYGWLVLSISLLILVGTFVILVVIPNLIILRLEKSFNEYRFGELGEEKIFQIILQVLDGTWSVYRNIDLPGRNKGDFDIILVGPPGVWVLEVKNYHGQYRNIGEKWEIFKKKSWKTAFSSPSRQAHKNAARLGNFLKADHIDTFVNAAVVWANEESPLFVENPTVVVWKFEDLADELKNIWHGEKLTSEERKKIDDKFQKLCNPDKDKTDKIKK